MLCGGGCGTLRGEGCEGRGVRAGRNVEDLHGAFADPVDRQQFQVCYGCLVLCFSPCMYGALLNKLHQYMSLKLTQAVDFKLDESQQPESSCLVSQPFDSTTT